MSYSPPRGAKFLAFMGTGADRKGVALYDVSHLMPRKRPWPKRDIQGIRRQYVHHSGTLRQTDPFKHLRSSARFSIRSRGWLSTGYHLWHPYFDVWDNDGNRVVYLANHPNRRTWHAGAVPNERGLAHCLQGNFTARPMSDAQRITLPVALHYYARTLGITPNALGHFQADDGNPKRACPGLHAEAWLYGYQAGRESRRGASPWV